MRQVLEAILSHSAGVDPATLAEIRRYAKLFFLNTGPYNNLTARKFVLDCTPDALAAAAAQAAKNGATFPATTADRTTPDAALAALLTRLRPMFFDPAFEPMVTKKTPEAGKDILAGQRQQPVRRA